MGSPLKNPPVYFTVVQARFNAILKMAEYLPGIQDGLRKTGFPAFKQQSGIALQIALQDGQPTPTPVPHEQFVFASADQRHSFVLGSDALTLQSTDYGTFESFSRRFLSGLALVHEVVRLDFTERVGLRYLDHVFPKIGDILGRYLAAEVHGLSTRLGGQAIHTFFETFALFGDVKLRTRVVQQDGPLSFPPDLLPQDMVVEARFLQPAGKHAILDNDGFIEQRQPFSAETVERQLVSIHKVIGAAFRIAATDYARSVWDE